MTLCMLANKISCCHVHIPKLCFLQTDIFFYQIVYFFLISEDCKTEAGSLDGVEWILVGQTEWVM